MNLPESLFISGKAYGTKINQDNLNNKDLQMFYDTEQKGVLIIRNHTEASWQPDGSYNNIVFVKGSDWAVAFPEYADNFRLSTDRPKVKPQESVAPPVNLNAQVWEPGRGLPELTDKPLVKTKRKVVQATVEGEK